MEVPVDFFTHTGKKSCYYCLTTCFKGVGSIFHKHRVAKKSTRNFKNSFKLKKITEIERKKMISGLASVSQGGISKT